LQHPRGKIARNGNVRHLSQRLSQSRFEFQGLRWASGCAASPSRKSWNLETGLTEALRRWPDVPVASNFTARVLQAVEWEAKAEARAQNSRWKGMGEAAALVAEVASATVVVMAGLLAYFPHNSVKASN